VHAREAAVVAAAARPGEEDNRWGSRVGERGRGGWLGRSKAEAQRWVAARPNGRGKGSGQAKVEGEAGRGWAKSIAGTEFEKNFLSNFN
jgi:hypothetical protein